VLPGGGFDAPTWSVRVSLANLKDSDYVEVGKRIRGVLAAAYDEFRANKGG
jgi:aspartate 4-decarboxylase